MAILRLFAAGALLITLIGAGSLALIGVSEIDEVLGDRWGGGCHGGGYGREYRGEAYDDEDHCHYYEEEFGEEEEECPFHHHEEYGEGPIEDCPYHEEE